MPEALRLNPLESPPPPFATRAKLAKLANHLGLSRGRINMHVEDVFDQYGVHSREDLRERVALARRSGPSKL